MAHQDNKANFNSGYNQHNNSRLPVSTHSNSGFEYSSQPVFPGEYRQYGHDYSDHSNHRVLDVPGLRTHMPPFLNHVMPMNNQVPIHYGYPSLTENNNFSEASRDTQDTIAIPSIKKETTSASASHQTINSNENAGYTNEQSVSAGNDSNDIKINERQMEVNESINVKSTHVVDESELKKDTDDHEKNEENLSKDKKATDNVEMPDLVAVKEEPVSDNEEQNEKKEEETKMKHKTEEQTAMYDDSTDAESSDDSAHVKKKTKEKPKKSKCKALPKSYVPKQKTEFTCEVCGKVVLSLRALEKHKNLHTGKFKCDKCNKIFSSEMSLKNHDKVHTGFKGKEKCNVCFKTFYDRSSLNKHTLSVHMGIKNFQCDFCNLSFFAKKTYEEHVRVHTGERPFKCDVCPKTYKRISDLNHHLRLHKGETSHTCEVCGEGFRRTSELKRHMSTKHTDNGTTVNHGEEQVLTKSKTCIFCGLIFSTLKSLNEHISTHMDLHTNVQLSHLDRLDTSSQIREKEKMVHEMDRRLRTNQTQQLDGNTRVTTDQIDHEIQSILEKNKSVAKAFGVNNVPFNGLGNMMQSQASATISDMNRMDSMNVPMETTSYLKSLYEGCSISDQKTIESSHNNQGFGNDAVQISNNENHTPINHDDDDDDNNDDIDDNDDIEDNDVDDIESQVKAEIEIVNDEEPDYGGDTDIEDYNDYNYIMNDSLLVDNSVDETKDRKTNIKIKLEDSEEVKHDNDNKSHKPPGNKRKRKLKAPQKKRKREMVESCSDTSEEEWENTKKSSSKKSRKSSGKKSTIKSEDDSFDNDFIKTNPDDKTNLTCVHCGKVLSNKGTFEKHMNIHLGTFSCEICGKCFSKQTSLDTHMDNHNGKKQNTAKCNVCDKTFYDNSSLNKHVKAVHMDYKPYPCPQCDRKFSEKKTLTEHLRVHSGERPFACEFCGKTYKRAGELNFHIRKHSGEIKFNCPECGKGFMRMGLLRQHMMMKHDKDRPFRCFHCAKTFPTSAMLKDHKLDHLKDRKHVCEKCGSMFFTQTKLRKHMLRKSDCQIRNFCVNGMFVCKFCYQEFHSNDERKAHIDENHVNEALPRRTFPCHICGKQFSRPQGLKTHLKIHLNVRDHHCHICSASFIQKHHLTQHLATHTGVKPYQCNVCFKNFAHNATLYNHMKHH
ncbi:Broad-Complex [Mactra antiquata]